MTIIGSPVEHGSQFGFQVIIDDFTRGEFSKCGPLGNEHGVIEIREGGSKKPKIQTGLITPKDITVERGSTFTNLDLYAWSLACELGIPGHQKTITIVELNSAGFPARSWIAENALLADVEYGNWDSSQNEANIEKAVIKHEGCRLDLTF